MNTYSEGSSLLDLITRRVVKDDISRQLELTEEYDRTFGLYNHEGGDDLMSVLFQHPEEDPVTGSRSEMLAFEIITLRIPEMLNEGLTDILNNYPRWFLDKLIEKVRNIRKTELENIPPVPGDRK